MNYQYGKYDPPINTPESIIQIVMQHIHTGIKQYMGLPRHRKDGQHTYISTQDYLSYVHPYMQEVVICSTPSCSKYNFVR